VTVYWMVWDAAANWIVDRLDADGALPSVHALRAEGSRAAGRPPAPNCQTPSSLATLFTGTGPPEHGVTGYTVPDDSVIGAHRSGFGTEFPFRPPIWRAAAERGLRSTFVHVPWVFDDDGNVGPYVDAAIEAYNTRIAGHDVLALDGATDWPVADFPVRVEPTAAGTMLQAGGAVHALSPERGWIPIRLNGNTGFWVCQVGGLLVRTGTWQVRTAGSNAALVRALSDTPVFAGATVRSLYRHGLFGPRLVDGGDGGAEKVLLSSVDTLVQPFESATSTVLAGHGADLVVIYLPWTDDIGHEMVGWCDERSAAYRPDVADRAWDCLRHCYRAADRILGHVLRRATEHDTVLLTADHGMVGMTHELHINEILIDAGLAARAEDGLDLARSTVFYHPADNGLLMVNHELVEPDRVAPAMGKAMDVLRAHGVRDFLDENARPITAPAARAYVVLKEDWQPSATVDSGSILRPTAKSGGHVVNTGDSRLHATFAARGPGIPAGVDLGVVDNTIGALMTAESMRDDILGGLPL
jgi:hypothetical protein